MGIRCGIVGLPNVGKSTLFNAITKSKVEAANYPFCTIDPNVGIVPINDERLDQIAKIVKPEKKTNATIEFVDIAGLVKGASDGEGLGNQFLANIRETDAIIHIIRCFEDNDIIHVSGKPDPLNDIEIIQTELILADLKIVDGIYQKLLKNRAYWKGDLSKELLEKVLDSLEKGKNVNTIDFDENEKKSIKSLQLLSAKPVLYVANIDESSHNSNLELVTKFANKENIDIVAICANVEAQIVDLTEEEKQEFLADIGQKKSGLDILTQSAYKALGLQTYFTAGPKDVHAWTIKIGDTAPKAAGKIHSDFEKGFIRAEIIPFNDFIYYNGRNDAKKAGKLRSEGKNYIVQDGDIINFLFNV